ncbi:MAG: hypothetical protein A2505_11285 [Deltaproteobacteria bacterium RIFOXYD12_FULL_55_16]|nr:MAG: hypothetical protein A2505_11285 [Deltaproteobacteria bacterium RIFOXYD12_FULL_55_16]
MQIIPFPKPGGPCSDGAARDNKAAEAGLLPRPTAQRPNLALVSSNGREIDLHLGEAIRTLVYGPREDGVLCLLGIQDAPEPGGGSRRWEELAASLHDCFALLAVSAGESPKRILAERGISLLLAEGEIGPLVRLLYGRGKQEKP